MNEVIINEQPLAVTWEDNPSVSQLLALCSREPIRIALAGYGGFELVGDLGHQLTSNDHHLTATAGDILLYQSHAIVLMAGTNQWQYTRLGTVAPAAVERLKTLVGTGSATLEIRCTTPREGGKHE